MSIHRQYERQGLSTNSAEYERHKAERRAKNVEAAREILTRNGIWWTEIAMESTSPITFHVAKNRYSVLWIKYLPETGRWVSYDNVVHFGCRNLVRYLKGEVK